MKLSAQLAILSLGLLVAAVPIQQRDNGVATTTDLNTDKTVVTDGPKHDDGTGHDHDGTGHVVIADGFKRDITG